MWTDSRHSQLPSDVPSDVTALMKAEQEKAIILNDVNESTRAKFVTQVYEPTSFLCQVA